MDINVNSKSLYEQYVATQSSTETTSSKNKELVPLVQPKVSEQNKKIYEKLGLTQEQFIKLCEEFPNITTLTEDKQLDIINKKLTEIKSSETKTTQETEKTQTSPHSSTGEEKLVDNGVFNHKVYSKLSNDEKFAIYAAELAKNKFLYPSEGDKKTIEAWNTLTPEQQKAFIDAEISNLKKSEKGVPIASLVCYDALCMALYDIQRGGCARHSRLFFFQEEFPWKINSENTQSCSLKWV